MVDVAIIGSGPAGLQAALVLARTRKNVVVLDRAAPPRNGASHGVHNVLGLDGMLPSEIRERAWSQIDVYQSVRFVQTQAEAVDLQEDGFVITTSEDKITARKVIVGTGFRDEYPELDGFREAWADTIIPCPFCDGYENRDRVWCVVANSKEMAGHLPKLALNWTSKIKLILNVPNIQMDVSLVRELDQLGIPIYRGRIAGIDQENGKVQAVTLDNNEKIEVETLWWIPNRVKTPLEASLIEKFDLPLDEMGLIQVDENQQSSTEGLYFAGDIVRFSPSAMGAMEEGNTAAVAIIKSWF